jgi:hypothetical protein
MEGGMKVMGGRERRSKTPLYDLKEQRGYWNSEEEALGRSLWRTRFGSGYGLDVRQQNDQRMALKRAGLLKFQPRIPIGPEWAPTPLHLQRIGVTILYATFL